MSSDSSEAFCCIFYGMLFSNCFYMHTWLFRNHIILLLQTMHSQLNHMNDDVADG